MSTVSQGMYYNCKQMKVIELPQSIVNLESNCFAGCENITGALKLPKNLDTIGLQAFTKCYGLSKIIFNEKLKIIGDYAFMDCINLQDFNIPSSVTQVLQYAFADCKALTRVDIPANVTYLGEGAFKDCGSITKVIYRNPELIIGGQGLCLSGNFELRSAGPLKENGIDTDYDIRFA